MVEYSIQKRWPYKPQRSSVAWWYWINFYDKSADYIRAWVAYARHRFSAFITSPIMDIDPERR